MTGALSQQDSLRHHFHHLDPLPSVTPARFPSPLPSFLSLVSLLFSFLLSPYRAGLIDLVAPAYLFCLLAQAGHQTAVHSRDRQVGYGGLYPALRCGPDGGLRLVGGFEFGEQHTVKCVQLGEQHSVQHIHTCQHCHNCQHCCCWLILPADVHPVLQWHASGPRLRQLPVWRLL